MFTRKKKKKKIDKMGKMSVPVSLLAMPFPADRYGVDYSVPPHNVSSDNFAPIAQSVSDLIEIKKKQFDGVCLSS